MRVGIATVPLDTGRCPPWLFERMKRLARAIIFAIVEEFGEEEVLKRLADPVWFQSFGCVIGFDWNSSGLTTTTLGALKEAVRGQEKNIGIFICGGKGKTSLKTPDQIQQWGEKIGFDEKRVKSLIYASKISAKIDNSALQDGYTLYHHNLIFTRTGKWTVIQQGMNEKNSTARRYHWLSFKIKNYIEEPHSGIITQKKTKSLNLVAKESKETREISAEFIKEEPKTFWRDFVSLQKYPKFLIKKQKIGQLTLMNLKDVEFYWHPVLKERFDLKKLKKTIEFAHFLKPKNFEELILIRGVGPKTIRALTLVAEIIYGKKPSYEDPARYSFAHGGKDRIPYPVAKPIYDETIEIIEKAINRAEVSLKEKEEAKKKLSQNVFFLR
ncbi:MAG: DUF763 domain-containing protein [Candidatus Pacebacteria bacterium]|nr:DUF763 domain-containing protein [Candidatus Paceibacterota bacterium]